jgi:hypothetical protein
MLIETYAYRGSHPRAISIIWNGSEAVRWTQKNDARASKGQKWEGGGKEGETRRRRRRRRRRRKRGPRIWPLQLEERGKAEVANPCKEPLYFLKEVLRAPDVFSSPGP